MSKAVLLGGVVDLQKVGLALRPLGHALKQSEWVLISVLFLSAPCNMRELVLLLHAHLPQCAAWLQQ